MTVFFPRLHLEARLEDVGGGFLTISITVHCSQLRLAVWTAFHQLKERFRDFSTIHLVFAARRQMNIMTLPPGPEPKGMELLIGFVKTLLRAQRLGEAQLLLPASLHPPA